MEKSKSVGRVGPPITHMDFESTNGRFKKEHPTSLEFEASSQFASVRANTGIFKGVFYYEVLLKTDGLMQIGWCTLLTPFTYDDGVGDDESSFAFDGFRVKKWGAKTEGVFGKRWKCGDTVGCLLDLNKR